MRSTPRYGSRPTPLKAGCADGSGILEKRLANSEVREWLSRPSNGPQGYSGMDQRPATSSAISQTSPMGGRRAARYQRSAGRPERHGGYGKGGARHCQCSRASRLAPPRRGRNQSSKPSRRHEHPRAALKGSAWGFGAGGCTPCVEGAKEARVAFGANGAIGAPAAGASAPSALGRRTVG